VRAAKPSPPPAPPRRPRRNQRQVARQMRCNWRVAGSHGVAPGPHPQMRLVDRVAVTARSDPLLDQMASRDRAWREPPWWWVGRSRGPPAAAYFATVHVNVIIAARQRRRSYDERDHGAENQFLHDALALLEDLSYSPGRHNGNVQSFALWRQLRGQARPIPARRCRASGVCPPANPPADPSEAPAKAAACAPRCAS
jgi:hypothetical protein